MSTQDQIKLTAVNFEFSVFQRGTEQQGRDIAYFVASDRNTFPKMQGLYVVLTLQDHFTLFYE